MAKFIKWYITFLLLGSIFVVAKTAIQKGILRALGYALSIVLAIILFNGITMLLVWWEKKRKK